MSFNLLEANIEKEKQIIREIIADNSALNNMKELESRGEKVDINKKRELERDIESLVVQLKALNDAVPELVKNIPFYNELEESKKKKKNLKDIIEIKDKGIAIPKKSKKSFLKSLKFKKKETDLSIAEKYNGFIKVSNRIFKNISNKLIKRKYFDSLNIELRKIASPFILTSYVSMMLFTTMISAILGFFIFLVLLFFNPLIGVLVLFILPLTTFILFYYSAFSQRKSYEKEINQELPFITVYMSAIATSGLEPSKIFDIIVRTKDYPFTQREMKRLLNYINFYGYDIVSALRLSSKNSPSERLGLLFNGLATSISSGGDLRVFLDKHAETLLFDYRVEREKYTKVAETFMDIYISVVIAAPMILMMVFVMLSLTGWAGFGLSASMLSFLIIIIISLLNIGFILFLNVKQPKF